jgi:hypothetical protein
MFLAFLESPKNPTVTRASGPCGRFKLAIYFLSDDPRVTHGLEARVTLCSVHRIANNLRHTLR